MTDSGEIDPVEGLLLLLPEKCRNCSMAQFMVGALIAFSDSTGGPDETIKDIEEKCPGFVGVTQEPPSAVNIVRDPFKADEAIIDPTPTGVAPNAFVFALPDGRCQYPDFS